jgi:hypothetical protein
VYACVAAHLAHVGRRERALALDLLHHGSELRHARLILAQQTELTCAQQPMAQRRARAGEVVHGALAPFAI